MKTREATSFGQASRRGTRRLVVTAPLLLVPILFSAGAAGSVGVAAELPDARRDAGGDRSGNLRYLQFDFHFQPWGEVFDWLAAQTGVPIQRTSTPLGTLNYSDPRRYTPSEAIALLDRILAAKGYRLIQRDEGLVLVSGVGPQGNRDGRPAGAPVIVQWGTVPDFPERVAVFESVFWDPRDTMSMREHLRRRVSLRGKTVLEIGTGSGLLALCCLRAGAARVVATEVNPAAIQNAAFNAKRMGLQDRLDLRLVPLEDADAYSVIRPTERFDLIVSNPPWEDALPTRIEEYALYDRNFRLLESLLHGLESYLEPGGQALLAYGCVDAIRTAQRLAQQENLDLKVLDHRDLDRLPNVFLPGMLLEVRPR